MRGKPVNSSGIRFDAEATCCSQVGSPSELEPPDEPHIGSPGARSGERTLNTGDAPECTGAIEIVSGVRIRILWLFEGPVIAVKSEFDAVSFLDSPPFRHRHLHPVDPRA